ncbi:hypothetical protein KUF71_000819 [Frankliniella fusca]|uniref:Uncharacterized protein n=1 Tax=Frankliniella fusca TaxID=407009 RepID=A0AAE1LEM3_9NEOP|nr:hypothetical protein KUF71_000819 [Frankliniella fusca]
MNVESKQRKNGSTIAQSLMGDSCNGFASELLPSACPWLEIAMLFLSIKTDCDCLIACWHLPSAHLGLQI